MAKAGSELRLDGSGNPVWLLLELTYQCPLQCVFCSNPRNFADYRKDELSTAEWIDVMSQARALGALQIGFSGGEPTLRKDLETLVAEADRMGYYTNLITSGLGLTEARLRALKAAGLRHIQLGFQSTDPGVAKQLAGVDVWQRKRDMARLIKAMDFPMVLNVPITRQNIAQVPDIIAFAAELGIEYLELANVQYYNWALLNREQLMPTRAELERAEAQVREARQRLGDRLTIFFVIPDYYEGRPKACMNGWGAIHLTISPNGDALPCSQAANFKNLTFPNVRRQPLEKIWHDSPVFDLYRGDAWMPEPCRSCDEKEKDFGGCRCQALLLTGSGDNADPACSKSPHHHLIRQAVELAQRPARPDETLIPRHASQGVDVETTP
ncbi:pyrroloquinoline quinone biosynthesis protein PqqE [Stutzerimonas stutzeri]|uniref:pyrroloquinoline quinone biosynthesis protein PqqE n=1 Tax=Stutzerimonas stutzeri TaxID=316 RepID=UPI0015E35165|nr:pyrroloquinoline quinone biosynthesis protein PqqE [Stutzerimonas stutzeri]MBA1265727.1 pyrroloquinoline quinone biosynthesis protein PqqE [Stutzerimonas stutzeri]